MPAFGIPAELDKSSDGKPLAGEPPGASLPIDGLSPGRPGSSEAGKLEVGELGMDNIGAVALGVVEPVERLDDEEPTSPDGDGTPRAGSDDPSSDAPSSDGIEGDELGSDGAANDGTGSDGAAVDEFFDTLSLGSDSFDDPRVKLPSLDWSVFTDGALGDFNSLARSLLVEPLAGSLSDFALDCEAAVDF